jgi:hypothetical protein
MAEAGREVTTAADREARRRWLASKPIRAAEAKKRRKRHNLNVWLDKQDALDKGARAKA